MKRKAISLFVCVALVFCLFGTLAVPAHAATYTCTVGESVWWVVDIVDFSHTTSSQGLPPGLTLGQNDGCFIIHGTPTQAGTYNGKVYYHCYIDPNDAREGTYGTYDTVTITVKSNATPTPTPWVPPTPSGTFSGHEYRTPTPPPTAAPTTAPTAAPSATPTAAAQFAITRHPTKETIPVGGSAKFVANATGYAWCAWRFVSPDGKTEVIFDVIGPHFPGMKVTGGNSTVMEISNVPMELNGWKAVCLFSDASNKWLYTDGSAVITVEQNATPTPTATPEPTPTATPTAAPTEAPTAPPTEAPTAAPEQTKTPLTTPEPTAAPQKADKGGNAIVFVLIGIIALLLIGGIVALVLVRRKRMEELRAEEEYERRARRTAGASTAARGRTWVCSKCGTTNDGKFCKGCGDPIDPTDRF